MPQVQSCCSGRTAHAEYISVYRGKIPTGDEILQQEDIVKLKRCIYSAQVNLCTKTRSNNSTISLFPNTFVVCYVFRILQRNSLPPICTHNVCEDESDQILNALRRCQLFNRKEDRVKVEPSQF